MPSPAPLMGLAERLRIEPAMGPDPSMVVAEKLNIPLPKGELLKEARAEPWPTTTLRPLLFVPGASW